MDGCAGDVCTHVGPALSGRRAWVTVGPHAKHRQEQSTACCSGSAATLTFSCHQGAVVSEAVWPVHTAVIALGLRANWLAETRAPKDISCLGVWVREAELAAAHRRRTCNAWMSKMTMLAGPPLVSGMLESIRASVKAVATSPSAST